MSPGQAVTFVFSRRIFQWASCVRPTESRPDLHSSSTAPRSFAKSPSAHLHEQTMHHVALTVLSADTFWRRPTVKYQFPGILSCFNANCSLRTDGACAGWCEHKSYHIVVC